MSTCFWHLLLEGISIFGFLISFSIMSDFIVSARKYRPLKFEEVVGQNHVAKTLKNALRTDHLAHAFLFCGPRGVGKTTCARILAKTINCENVSADFEACGTCHSCKSFAENTSFNIIELDAASHNSVDHMRTLVEQIRFQPPEGRYKVYIIDEVHMLSSSAFNAFLKTLEEPPPYAIFILATTEKHKIIPTILSRCQVFDFKRIQVQDIVKQLLHICQEEGIQSEEDGLVVIAQKADGALRDALSIFDRIVSLSGKSITYQEVIESLNLLDYDYYFQITDAILAEDLPGLITLYDQILKNGFEGDIFINGLSSHFRDLLMCKDPKTTQLLDYGPSVKEQFANQSGNISHAQLMTFLQIANECDIHYPRAQNKRLHVEIALSKMCFHQRMQPAVMVEEGQREKKNLTANRLDSKPTINESKKAMEEVNTSEPEHTPTTQPQEQAGKPEEKAQESIQPPKSSSFAPQNLKEKKPNTPANGNGAMIHTPTLNRIQDLQLQVEQAEEQAKRTKKELNTSNLTECWNAYLESTTSPSVKSTLSHARPEVIDGKISIAVATQTARTRILEETELIEQIRQFFNQQAIEMKVWMDTSMEGYQKSIKKPKKLLTNKEKYEMLVRKNPLMVDLKNALDLIVDQDK
jgi:DNA polymerase-3 subunit gamma/tau